MRKQIGDTLVEVMIAMAIIGSVIAISYGTASRALRVGRYAQERTEALKLAEGQIEMLKASASISTTLVYSTPSPSFCMNADGSINIQNAINTDLFADPLISSSTGAPIAGQTYHLNCAQGTDGRYKLSIVRTDAGVGAAERNSFVIRARWDRLGGGKDEVVIYYRLHERLFR